MKSNIDLQEAFGPENTARAAEHWQTSGRQEGRDCTCPETDEKQYRLEEEEDVEGTQSDERYDEDAEVEIFTSIEQLCELAEDEEILDVPCETINEALLDNLAEGLLDVCLGTDMPLRSLCSTSS